MQSKTNKHRLVEAPLLDRMALAVLLLFLSMDVLSGAVRYYAVQFHLARFPYLPHLLIALAVVPLFLVYLLTEGVTSTYLIVLVLFGVGTIYGLLNLSRGVQVVFGLWVLVSFLYGIVVLPAILRSWRKLVPYALLLWAIADVGVLINFFHTWPWIGLEYQVGATSIEASRMWHVGGVNIARLPGFSRASYSVAFQLLVLSLFLWETMNRRWRIPMWILSGAAIILTTSKTAIVIFILFSVLWLFGHGRIPKLWHRAPLCLACIDILLPFSMLFVRKDWFGSVRSTAELLLVSSFVGRMQGGWPKWIRMIVDRGNVVIGRGIGGIGAAQYYFEPAIASPGDNIAVYLYGIFGVLGLALLLVYGWKAAHARGGSPVARFFFSSACAVLLVGITVNVLEGAFLAIAFGASLRYFQEGPVAFLSREALRRRRPSAAVARSQSRPECA